MKTFRVDFKVTTVQTFFVEAESEAEVEAFLEENDQWDPASVEGLVDGELEEEEGWRIVEDSQIVAEFFIEDGELLPCD